MYILRSCVFFYRGGIRFRRSGGQRSVTLMDARLIGDCMWERNVTA